MENNPYLPPSSEITAETPESNPIVAFFKMFAGVLLIIFSVLILIISIVGIVGGFKNLFSDFIPIGFALAHLLSAGIFLLLGWWMLKVGIRLVTGKKNPESGIHKPIWVKLFLIYVSMGAIGRIYTYLIMFGTIVPITFEQRLYFEELGILNDLFIFSSVLLNLAAGIALFQLRAIAVKLLLISVIITPILTGYTLFIASYTPSTPGEELFLLVSSIIRLGILIAIFLYSVNLKQQGKLS
jgi:hypothetical protein